MPYVVLAHRGDTDAELVARALAARTAAEVALVWADELLLDSRFTHRIEGDEVETHFATAGGLRLVSSELRGLVCRLVDALPPQFAGAAAADRDYAAMEAQALLLSWLASLRCPLLNPPSPRSLNGPALGLLEWLQLGAGAGLDARRLRLAPPGGPPPGPGWLAAAPDLTVVSTAALSTKGVADLDEGPRLWLEPLEVAPRQLLVVGERVLGEIGPDDGARCLDLARRARSPVLGIHLAPSPRGEVLCGASTMPSLGPAGAEAVAELLIAGAE